MKMKLKKVHCFILLTLMMALGAGASLLSLAGQKSFGRKLSTNSPETAENSIQSASAIVQGETYYGVKAIMNIWEPHVEEADAYSASQIWIAGGSFDSHLNAITAGWHVCPELYGHNNTSFFIYWTRDNFESTGCFNLLCPGFVQTNDKYTVGGVLPISHLNFQSEMSVFIWKDSKQDVWWLELYGDTIGYWPASLFTNMKNNASIVEWSGQVSISASHGAKSSSTQMGSGHFPSEGLGAASYIAYMRNLQVLVENMEPMPLNDPSTIVDRPNCYNITLEKNDEWEDYILYGGRGRNPDCP